LAFQVIYGWEGVKGLARIVLTRTMIIAIVAVISVALIATVAYFYLSGDGGDGGNGNGETWHEGDFVEWGTYYYTSEGGKPGDNAGYVRYTITDIDATRLTIERTYYNPARIELQTLTFYEPKNSTGFGYAASDIDFISYPVTDLGTDTVETELGQLSAHHYQYSYEALELTYTVDLWTRGGFIVVQDTTSTAELQQLISVTDTNVPAIYS
jgi:hypothetical protein